jgi:hypothetical protein
MGIARKQKQCKRCKKQRYLFGRGYCENCYKVEVLWRASSKAKKRKRKPISTTGKSAKAKAKAEAWVQFSLYIRARDANAAGICQCCTCGKAMQWHGTRKCQAGHYISRRHLCTLFDERNVHAQCAGCNKWQHGNAERYRVFMLLKYGQGVIDELQVKAKGTCRLTEAEYRAIGQHYAALWRQIAKDKGIAPKGN